MKRYISSCLKYSIFLDLEDGRTIKLVFEGKDAITKERFVDVSDPLIIKALESSPSFDTDFIKSSEFNGVTDEELKDLTVIPGTIELDHITPILTPMEFDNITYAKDWINKTHGVQTRKVMTSAGLIKEFKALGFDLQIKSLNN